MDKQALLARIAKLTTLHKILIAVGAVLILSAAGVSLLILPNYEDMEKLETQVRDLDSTLARLNVVASKLPKLRSEMDAMRIEYAFAQTLLPDDPQKMEGLMSSIESAGREVGVEFLSFVPSQDETKADFYASRRIQLRLRGSFHDLMLFYDRLTRLDRLCSLEQFTLRPQPPSARPVSGLAAGQPAGIALGCDSTLLVYRLLTQAELEQPTPDPKATPPKPAKP